MSDSNNYVFKSGEVGSEVVIFGQGDGTLTITNNGVDITNKANGGAITYLDGASQGLRVTWATTFVLSSETAQNAIKSAMMTKTQIEGTIETGVGGETFSGSWMVGDRSDTAGLNSGTGSSMAITFYSSGGVTHTEATVTP